VVFQTWLYYDLQSGRIGLSAACNEECEEAVLKKTYVVNSPAALKVFCCQKF
jgi:hypothetical protein